MTDTAMSPEEARRRLYRIMDRDEPFEAKAREALALGATFLGVENGHVAKINPEAEYWETVVSTDTDSGMVPAGTVADLRTMYCRHAVDRDTSIAIHDAVAQGRDGDPAFEEHDRRCYHGTPVTVSDEFFGTVCFVSSSPREPFTEAETAFAELVARLFEKELESRRHETEVTRQANFNTVLNRVLRHNLRNSMTVIRAEARMLAEAGDASP